MVELYSYILYIKYISKFDINFFVIASPQKIRKDIKITSFNKEINGKVIILIGKNINSINLPKNIS